MSSKPKKSKKTKLEQTKDSLISKKKKKVLAPKDVNVSVVDEVEDIDDDFEPIRAAKKSAATKSSDSDVVRGLLNENQSQIQKQTPLAKWGFSSQSSVSLSQQQQFAKPLETQLWIDKYAPFTEDEMAVHKRKIKDVRSWFQDALLPQNESMRRMHKSHRLLALTGISGSAKTAVVKMLSMELDFEIVEWINPVNEFSLDSVNDDDENIGYSSSLSVMQKFSDFVSSARKTNALVFGSSSDSTSTSASSYSFAVTKQSPKIILIEDLPNLSNASSRASFHALLRNHVFSVGTSVHPIVLILSDTVASASSSFGAIDGGGGGNSRRGFESVLNLKNLVPEDVRASSAFTKIQFTSTLLIKALTRVVSQEFRGLSSTATGPKKPTYAQIESIANSSGGDIRCALNTLQFLTLFEKNGAGLSMDAGNRKGVGCRDVSLIFYHALNKVMVGKRLEPNEAPDEVPGERAETFVSGNGGVKSISSLEDEEHQLPDHLKHFTKKPLKSNPEHVFESSHTDAAGFISYLAENYTSMFTQIEECVAAADSYCEADVLSGTWMNRPTMNQYSASIACRATMFARTHPLPPTKFGSLRKPSGIQSFVARREAVDMISEAEVRWNVGWFKGLGSGSSGFQVSNSYSNSVMTMELIPYASRITAGAVVTGRVPKFQLAHQDKVLFNKICTYTQNAGISGYRKPGELLDETDVGNDEDNDGGEENVSGSQRQRNQRNPFLHVVHDLSGPGSGALHLVEDDIED
ncbi:UNVERIFIED_CONTAM: Cell cycle checkpoint protein rad17 [Siphonaria sp. JEL0065]|nr:Cell cycle checkpoint protein rad17 [Siphonaria sp. JEL0065]